MTEIVNNLHVAITTCNKYLEKKEIPLEEAVKANYIINESFNILNKCDIGQTIQSLYYLSDYIRYLKQKHINNHVSQHMIACYNAVKNNLEYTLREGICA